MKRLENIRACAKTDIGLKRENNEDSYLIVDNSNRDYDTRTKGMIFAVADGMGGHLAGETASKMACEGLYDYYSETADVQDGMSFPESRLRLLEKVIRNTHDKILSFGEKNDECRNMGTTLSVLVLVHKAALLAHVGDSRIYRLRNGAMDQLTEDHTMAQLSVEMGYLKPDEIANHPMRSALTQAIGGGLDEVQTRTEKIKKGDIFLLCSDGLYNAVADEEIMGILRDCYPPHDACDQLVRKALRGGGKDNVTVIVIWL